MDKKRSLESLLTRSYSPYSDFKVAALLTCKDGTIFTGVNIENASYPAGVCAERVAFFKAISEGYRDFDSIMIGSSAGDYCPPCGICRQVMAEFCDGDFKIILTRAKGDAKTYKLSDLFPLAFDLKEE